MHKLRTLAVVVALAAAFGLVACGGGGDDTGGGGSGGATTYDGSWKGTTSQGKPVSFTVEGGVVTQFSIAWKYEGSTCSIVSSKISGPEKAPIKDGQTSIRNVKLTFDSETSASGAGNFAPDPASKPACQAADITFKASSSG